MAGIMVFRSGDWRVSGDTFRGMAEGVSRHVRGDEIGSQIKDELDSAVKSRVYFVDAVKSFTPDMLIELSKAVESHLADAVAQGAAAHENPELYPGYIARLNDLQSLIAKHLTLHENDRADEGT